jgi:hypothetical protein
MRAIRSETTRVLRLAAAAAARRFVAECLYCHTGIPPDQEGLVLSQEGPLVRRHWVAAFCGTCDAVWIVGFSSPTAAGQKRGLAARLSAPRRATAIEERMAEKMLFRRRGRPRP